MFDLTIARQVTVWAITALHVFVLVILLSLRCVGGQMWSDTVAHIGEYQIVLSFEIFFCVNVGGSDWNIYGK